VPLVEDEEAVVVVAVEVEEESCKKENILASVGLGKLRRVFSTLRGVEGFEGKLPRGPRRFSGGIEILLPKREVVEATVAVLVEEVVEFLCSNTGDELSRDFVKSNSDPRFSWPITQGPSEELGMGGVVVVGAIVVAMVVVVVGEVLLQLGVAVLTVTVVAVVAVAVEGASDRNANKEPLCSCCGTSTAVRNPNGEFLRSLLRSLLPSPLAAGRVPNGEFLRSLLPSPLRSPKRENLPESVCTSPVVAFSPEFFLLKKEFLAGSVSVEPRGSKRRSLFALPIFLSSSCCLWSSGAFSLSIEFSRPRTLHKPVVRPFWESKVAKQKTDLPPSKFTFAILPSWRKLSETTDTHTHTDRERGEREREREREKGRRRRREKGKEERERREREWNLVHIEAFPKVVSNLPFSHFRFLKKKATCSKFEILCVAHQCFNNLREMR